MNHLSKLWSLSISDFWRGLIVAVLAAVLQPILVVLQGGGLVFDWKAILTVGLTAGLAYLLKNISTTQNGAVLGGTVDLPDTQPKTK